MRRTLHCCLPFHSVLSLRCTRRQQRSLATFIVTGGKHGALVQHSLTPAAAAAAVVRPSTAFSPSRCSLSRHSRQMASDSASRTGNSSSISSSTTDILSVSTGAATGSPIAAAVAPSSSLAPTTSLSTAEPPKEPLLARLRRYIKDNRRRWSNYVVLSVAAAATYSVYAASAELVVFMSSIQHRDTLEAAFLSGAAVVASGLLSFGLARRVALRIHLPPLYKQCLRRLRSDDSVRRLIGHTLRMGPQAAAAPHVPASSSILSTASSSGQSSSAASSLRSDLSATSAVVPGFRIINCLPPGPRWHRLPGVTYWGWERYWRPRRAQFVVSLSGDRGSGVMLAQVDSKLNESRRIAWLSVESIQSHSQPHSTLPRLVLEDDKGGWTGDAEKSKRS